MNLAAYAKIEQTGGGEFIKFENTGDVKYLRFMYESGGDTMGADVTFYRKYWDDENKRYVVGTDEGQLVAALKAIEYDEDGKNPRVVRWERSAYFCKTVLLPMWRNYPRIMDGVWKITATSPKTLDASYAIFPVMNADTIKYPVIEDAIQKKVDNDTASPSKEKETTQPTTTNAEPTPAKETTKKKYWE